MRKILFNLCLYFCLASLFGTEASANVGEAFGYGSRAQALAGSGTVLTGDAFTTYHNPAALALPTEQRLIFNFGVLFMQPSFTPINNVVTQNSFVADGISIESVNTSYDPTFGQQFALSYKLFPDFLGVTLGIASFIPIEQIAAIDTGEGYAPEYVLYRSRTQRPQFEMGIAMRLMSGISIGAGIHLAYSLNSSGNVFINAANNTASTMRFTSKLQPKVAPYFGLLYTAEKDENSAPVRLKSVGLVIRTPVGANNAITLNSAARVLGELAAIDFNFSAYSALFFDPGSIELGTAIELDPRVSVFLQLDYQFWDKFEPPALIIQQPVTIHCENTDDTSCGTVQISPGVMPGFHYVGVWIPRFAVEGAISDKWTIRFGAAYRSSFLSGVPNGNGNYLDPPKYTFNLGAGVKFNRFLDYNIPVQVDFNISCQILENQSIIKTPGNEVGLMTDQKIGSPGYTAGGFQLGGGVTLSLAF